jgi:hypothetical protein
MVNDSDCSHQLMEVKRDITDARNTIHQKLVNTFSQQQKIEHIFFYFLDHKFVTGFKAYKWK